MICVILSSFYILTGCPDGRIQNIPDPENCSTFHSCIDGSIALTQQCSGAFDPAAGICKDPWDLPCTGIPQTAV